MFLKSASRFAMFAEFCSAKPKILTRLKNLVKHLAFQPADQRIHQLASRCIQPLANRSADQRSRKL
jgi:hypothetical protein